MFYRKMKNMWLQCLALAAAVLLIASCGTKPDKPEPINKAPRVEIVNVPPDGSHFTTNAEINWFATDADGYIIAYEYTVVPESLVTADPGNPASVIAWVLANIHRPISGRNCAPESCWNYINVKTTDRPNSQTIHLYAGATPADTVSQYFFVRAIDNDSLVSNIEYRLYSRTNHPPDTEIKTIPDPVGYFDLPETTLTYRGIYFEWKGTDKIDYPNDNPEPQFDYFYQVYGPYDSTEIPWAISGPDSGRVDGKLFDTTESKLILGSQDSTGSVWVKQNFCKVYNLWRKEPSSGVTRSAWFVLKVASRDDAFVSDSMPAYTPFYAIYPKFENDVLIYVAPFCVTSESPGEIACEDTSTVFNFYREAFKSSRYTIPELQVGARENENFPTRLTLSKHKLVILLGDGEGVSIKKTFYDQLTPYLDLGGNLWVWATAPFGGFYAGNEPALKPLLLTSMIPFMYFDVISEFRGGWRSSYIKRFSTPKAPFPITNEEFIGGLALQNTGLRDFKIESLEKIKQTYITLTDTIGYSRCCIHRDSHGDCDAWSQDTCDTFIWVQKLAHWVAAPNANYFVRDVYSEPLWLFNSYYGDFVPDSLQSIITGLQGKVIAVRFDSGIFRTAAFGFSMYMLKLEDAADIVEKMLDWFLK